MVPLYLLALAAPLSVTASGIAAGLVLLTAGGVLAGRREPIRWPPRPILWSLAALAVCYLLATFLAAPYPRNWVKLVEELWVKSLLIAVPVVAGTRTEHLERVLKWALGMGVVAAAYAVVQHFLGFDPIRDRSLYRPEFGHAAVSGFLGHHLSFAGQLIAFCLLATSWLLLGRERMRAGFLVPMLAVLWAALFWNYSRSGWLGVLAGTAVLVACLPPRRRRTGLGVLAALPVVLLAVPPSRAHFLSIFQLEQHATRLNLWRDSWHGILDQPLLGFGPGNFERLLAEHQVPGHYDTLAHAHNDLLMHGVNAGLPGLLAAVALIYTTCRLFWRSAVRERRRSWIWFGALALQVGITVAGIFQVFQTDDEVETLLYLVLGCAVGLAAGLDGREVEV